MIDSSKLVLAAVGAILIITGLAFKPSVSTRPSHSLQQRLGQTKDPEAITQLIDQFIQANTPQSVDSTIGDTLNIEKYSGSNRLMPFNRSDADKVIPLLFRSIGADISEGDSTQLIQDI